MNTDDDAIEATPKDRPRTFKVMLAVAATALMVVGTVVIATTRGGGDDLAPAASVKRVGASRVQRYFVMAHVIESSGDGPRLCTAFWARPGPPPSNPTVCPGLPITNWTWDGLDSDKDSRDRIGEYALIGTYERDQGTFTLAEPARVAEWYDSDYETPADFSTPCPEPDGGWPESDEGIISDGLDRVTNIRAPDATGSSRPGDAADGYAGGWIGRNPHVLNVGIVGDLDAAEAAIRRRYDGPLCLVPFTRPYARLQAVEREIRRTEGGSIQALHPMNASNQVWVHLAAPDPELEQDLLGRYGNAIDIRIEGFEPLEPGEIPDIVVPSTTTYSSGSGSTLPERDQPTVSTPASNDHVPPVSTSPD